MAGILEPLQDFAVGQLAQDLGTSDTVLTLVAGAIGDFPDAGEIVVFLDPTDNTDAANPAATSTRERLRYTGRNVGANQLTGLARTNPVSFSNAATTVYRVWRAYTAADHDAIDVQLGRISVDLTAPSIGGKGDGVTNNDAAFDKALAVLGSNPGTIRFPPGTFRFTSKRDVGLREVELVGNGREDTVILQDFLDDHLFFFRRSHRVRDLSFSRAGVDQVSSWSPIRTDFSTVGVADVPGTRLEYRNLLIEGPDIGIYADGNASHSIELVLADNVVVRTNPLANSPNAGGENQVRPSLNFNRCQRAVIRNCDLKVYGDGRVNNVYTIGTWYVLIDNCRIEKGVGVKINSEFDEVRQAVLRNLHFVDTAQDVQCLSAAYPVRRFLLDGIYSERCLCLDLSSAVIFNTFGAAPADGYDFGQVTIRDSYWRDARRQIIGYSAQGGRTHRSHRVMGNTYENWSLDSPGTYAVAGAVDPAGIYQSLVADHEVCFGNNNGRCWAHGGLTADFDTLNIGSVEEFDVQVVTQTDDHAVRDLRSLVLRKGLRLEDTYAQSGSSAATRQADIIAADGTVLGAVRIYPIE